MSVTPGSLHGAPDSFVAGPAPASVTQGSLHGAPDSFVAGPAPASLTQGSLHGAPDSFVAGPAPASLAGVRLVIIVDGAAPLAGLAAMLDALGAGAALVQVRDRTLDGGALLARAVATIAVARPRGAVVLVNDRLDVALAAGADGVHLPEAGLSVGEARAIAARAGAAILVGCSRHAPATAAAAARDGADLVVLGPIWATPSKAGLGEPLGPAALTEARAAIAGRARLCAIGGIDDAARATEARRAGADAVAAIRALWSAGDPAAAAAALIRDTP